jgi:GH24 family phage-related lysozyme (muramidase)
MALQIPDEAVALILEFEGVDQPSEWPGESSGITIGAGYDLGFCSAEQFEEDWSPFLSGDEIERLKGVIGVAGDAARRRAGEFRDIRIKAADAEEVFKERTLPKYSEQTEGAFPGVDQLPPKVQGALVSLVFNRGAGMDGDRRREMRAIRDAVTEGNLQEIANQLREMKRLWPNTLGLRRRRDAEADFVESAIDN